MRWLQQARTDLHWADHLAQAGAHYLVCFLAQQVAEKALKAFLYASGEELVVGHSVRQLCARAGEHESRLAGKVTEWAILDSYYIPTRYPNGLPDDIPARVYNESAAQSALALATSVVDAITAFLPPPDPNAMES